MTHMVIRGLDFRNLVHVFEINRSKDLMAWFRSALVDSSGFFEKECGWWRFGEEGECTVRSDCYESGSRNANFYVGCSCVKFFAEVHRLDTLCSESRTYGRCGSSLACCDEQTLKWK